MINWYDKVNIIRPDLSGYRRIIAVSDIHANLDYFQHLLEKIKFGKEDALIIAGDFLEKGERSLDTLSKEPGSFTRCSGRWELK